MEKSYGGVFADAAAFNRNVKLLWLGAETAEPMFFSGLAALHAALDKQGVNHVKFESAGTAHEWQTWRRSLYDFSPRLLRD